MQQNTTKYRFGELLCAVGLTDRAGLEETIKMSRKVGLPIGRALVFSGQLTEPQLRVAIELQSLMRNHDDLTLELARNAVGMVQSQGISLQEALRNAGWQLAAPQLPQSTLGKLLVEAKLVGEQELEEARKLGYDTGMPIGKTLVLSSYLSEEHLRRTLEAQRAIRNGSVSHEDAVKQLIALKASGPAKVVQQAQKRQYTSHPRIRLGDLLMLAGVLTENDVLNALELGLSKHQSVGEALVSIGAVSQPVLNLALEFQQRIADGQAKLMEAVSALQKAMADDHSGAGAHRPQDPIMLGELLRMSGLIDDDDITHAIELMPKFPAMLGKMLVVAGAIDDATLLSALRCQFLLRHQLISLENAVLALQYSQRNMLSFDDALDELGIAVAAPQRRDVIK